MKQYNANNIKNILVAGHGSSGKTSLVEAILHMTNTSDRFGKVDEGNTVSDFDAEEIKRKVSLNLSVAPYEYRDYKINLLDAPGLFDFEAGFFEGIRACESVLLTVSGKSGVSVGTKKAFKKAKKLNKATMIYVGKLDRESADFYKVLEQLKTEFGPSICPVVVPYVIDRKVDSYINLIDMKAYKYNSGVAEQVVIPDIEHRLEGLITAISEAVAETDEALFEKYFSGEKFTNAELIMGIHKGVKNGDITPVFCGSSLNLDGIDMLIDGISTLLPTAQESAMETAIDENGNEVAIMCDETKPLVATVFKTVMDPFIGKLSYVKVISGKLVSDTQVINMTTNQNEKISKLSFIRGKKQEDTKEIVAGDIGVILKTELQTFDTICKDTKVTLSKIEFPKPCYSMALRPLNKGDESKISSGMHKLILEDMTVSYTHDYETHQQIISGLGEQHLDVCVCKLKNKFGVDVLLEKPVVAYREAIRKTVKVQGKHKKQSGGHGQFGDVWIEFSPCDSSELIFEEKIFGGAVPKNFFPAVEKGLRECVNKGVIAGYPVVNLKATLLDGSYHPVDSSEMAFKMAATLAYKNALPNANPVLLEPIGYLKVCVPDSITGDMMGELNKRRGRVMGMNPDEDSMTIIEAEVPMSEMHDFSTLVRQLTQGSGSFEIEFARYEQLPSNLEEKVIEEAKKIGLID